MILHTAYLSLCPNCGRTGQIFAVDGSHSWDVRSKIQAREAAVFLSEEGRITSIEVAVLKSIIDESPLPEQHPTDVDYEIGLTAFASRVRDHKMRIASGQASESEVMPWELEHPDAHPEAFLLARPKKRVAELVLEEPRNVNNITGACTNVNNTTSCSISIRQ